MMTSNAILGFLDHVKSTTLSVFPIENIYVYDDSLDFGERAIQYITRAGPYEKLETTVPTEWVIIIWNRGSLIKSDTNGRPMEITIMHDTEDRLDGISKFRMADLDVTMKFVTNSIELAEEIEEYLHVLAEESISFGFTDDILGDFSASAKPGATTDFEKESTEQYGSITSITLNAEIVFPVILPLREEKDIQTIIHEIIPVLSFD